MDDKQIRFEALKIACDLALKQERHTGNPKFWTQDTPIDTQLDFYDGLLELADICADYIKGGKGKEIKAKR